MEWLIEATVRSRVQRNMCDSDLRGAFHTMVVWWHDAGMHRGGAHCNVRCHEGASPHPRSALDSAGSEYLPRVDGGTSGACRLHSRVCKVGQGTGSKAETQSPETPGSGDSIWLRQVRESTI